MTLAQYLASPYSFRVTREGPDWVAYVPELFGCKGGHGETPGEAIAAGLQARQQFLTNLYENDEPLPALHPRLLYTGLTDSGHEIIVTYPAMDADANGAGFIVFSPNEARAFARLLQSKANDAESNRLRAAQLRPLRKTLEALLKIQEKQYEAAHGEGGLVGQVAALGDAEEMAHNLKGHIEAMLELLQAGGVGV